MPKAPGRIPRARDEPTQHASISTSTMTRPQKPNAFDVLMAPKTRATTEPVRKTGHGPRQNTWGREGLGGYIWEPDAWQATRIVRHTEKFVVIKDMFPKASVHYLILPVDNSTVIPHDAFEDPKFLSECKEEVKAVRHLVAEELRRLYGQFSESDQPRIAAMEAADLVVPLPSGRDWEKEVISGIHARPSMRNLHIHVLSRDMVNHHMKTIDHYQSFTTDFLVPLEEFPLVPDDVRRPQGFPPEHRDFQIIRNKGMTCWRCGANFKNKFADLKRHLAIELEEWKRE
ncbi:related to hydrolase (HIT family) [Ramularia collo-cygni]|uniref:Related to hydrolase (HIT family) n=1 Tax=Ramularia collo-cygni TaxID=112498 RepID=A0A2D3VHD0_9PEZI|nr:related to hydrolase (HIT family) [Ramularia collo-cygni]CZT23611.1 related to hydrolase (HIT family) [Ramularia collo-cygni]